MAALLFFIIFTALGIVESRYILHNEAKTWFEAQSYCREHYSDLATIVNTEQNHLLTTFGSNKLAWIGLYDNMTQWKWSIGNTDLDNNGFTNWRTSSPNYFTSRPSENKICVSMNDDRHWIDRDCGDALVGVCYEDPESYALVNDQMSWHSVQSVCRQSNKELTSVRDESESKVVGDMTATPTWIGLYRHTWVNWSDSTFSTFANWDQKMNSNLDENADFHCAMVDTWTGTWFRASCSSRYSFFCNAGQSDTGEPGGESGEELGGEPGEELGGAPESTPGSTSLFRLRLKTDADLKVAAIQSQMVQQICDKLEEKGIRGFKLRWTQIEGPSLDKEQSKKKKKKR